MRLMFLSTRSFDYVTRRMVTLYQILSIFMGVSRKYQIIFFSFRVTTNDKPNEISSNRFRDAVTKSTITKILFYKAGSRASVFDI